MESLLLLKYSSILYRTHRFSSSSLKPSLISRVRYVLNHYWLGSKLLYRNSRLIQEIKKKDENALTRIDQLSLEQFRYDIRVGIPFVGLFSIPIIGYSAPLLAILAPKYLPSTLIMPKQKVTFLKDDATASSSIIDSLIQFNRTQFNDQNIYGMITMMQFIQQIRQSSNRYDMIKSSLGDYSLFFNQYYPLSSLSREHLLLLHQSVLHSSFLARYFLSNYSLESQLEMWQYRTFIDDQQIKDSSKLSSFQLVTSLINRGLYLHLNEMGQILENEQINRLNQTNERIHINEQIINDWKQLLNQWIDIHLQLSKSNSLSTSFLLHLSPLLVQQ